MNSAGVPHTQAAGPFGYAFFQHEPASIPDPVVTTTSNSSEVPITGPSLLNSREEDYINTFFMSHAGQDMSGNSFEMAIQQTQDQLNGANMTQFGWLMNEAPPNFMGASATPKPTSAQYQHIPQHSSFDFSNAFQDGSDLMGNGMHHNLMSHASMMHANNNMQHSQMHPPQHTPSLVSAPSTEASDLMHTSDPLSGLPMSSTSLLINPPTTITAHEVRDILTTTPLGGALSGLAPIDTIHHDMHMEGPHTAPARMDDAADNRLYRFGSDSHFGLDGFKPSSNHERHDFIAHRLTEELHMLKPINRSNVPTRASSPVNHMGHSRKRSSIHIDHSTHAPNEDEEDHINRPKKRRKDSTDEDEIGHPPSHKRKFSVPNPRMRRISSTTGGDTISPSAKRRRSSVTNPNSVSAANAAKNARENLSEEQKRSNHIQSEQKRRNLIKLGFDELRRLVPELRAGGLSKSMELNEVSNFLEQVIKANEELRRRMGIVPG